MVRQIPAEIAERMKLLLEAIAKMFKASRITIIVRSPEEANSVGDLIFSNDNPTKVMEALRNHMVAQAQSLADEGARSGTPGSEWPKLRNIDEI